MELPENFDMNNVHALRDMIPFHKNLNDGNSLSAEGRHSIDLEEDYVCMKLYGSDSVYRDTFVPLHQEMIGFRELIKHFQSIQTAEDFYRLSAEIRDQIEGAVSKSHS